MIQMTEKMDNRFSHIEARLDIMLAEMIKEVRNDRRATERNRDKTV